MKKVISVLVALVLVICGFAFTANAEPSPEVDGVVSIIDIIDSSGNKASIDFVEIESSKIDTTLKPESKEESTIAQFDVKVNGKPEYPVTVTLKIKGVTTTSTVYVLAKNADNTVDKIAATVKADDTVELVLGKDYTRISIIVDKKTATSIGVSDKTGDNNSAIVMGILGLALALAVVSVKKIKA